MCLDIVDTAGQPEFALLKKGWYHKVDGFVVVYSKDNKQSLDFLYSFNDTHCARNGDSILAPMVLVSIVDCFPALDIHN